MPSASSPETFPGPMEVAVLFVDLVNSSTFASVLGLREYADYVHSFHDICLKQCDFFFNQYLEGKYVAGPQYSARITGDELVVFLHTGRPQNDVYQLACLAVMLKAAWLASPVNVERLHQRTPVAEISAGIHQGPIWATQSRSGSGFDYCGYAINFAKRVEGLSRGGSHYRIFLTDHAFKQIHFRLRNLIFGPFLTLDAKGILGTVGAYEIAHSFLNPGPRLHPDAAAQLLPVMAEVAQLASREIWVHDLFQVWSESREGRVTDEAMELCQRVIKHSPRDPSALYHLAQAHRERGNLDAARLILSDLVGHWQHFGDGHFELGKILRASGREVEASESLVRACLLGVDEAVEA